MTARLATLADAQKIADLWNLGIAEKATWGLNFDRTPMTQSRVLKIMNHPVRHVFVVDATAAGRIDSWLLSRAGEGTSVELVLMPPARSTLTALQRLAAIGRALRFSALQWPGFTEYYGIIDPRATTLLAYLRNKNFRETPLPDGQIEVRDTLTRVASVA